MKGDLSVLCLQVHVPTHSQLWGKLTGAKCLVNTTPIGMGASRMWLGCHQNCYYQ